MKSRQGLVRFVLKDLLVLLLIAVLLFLATVLANAQEIHAWGDNRWGQGNVPAGLKGVLAISSGVGHSVGMKYDGTITVWGLHAANSVTEVIAIASGNLHTAALKSDGTVVAWGNNFQGQLNIPPGLSNVTAIASGNMHTLALKADGTVVAWGSNTQNQSTVPGGLTDVIAISGGYSHSLALKANGTVVGWGTTSGTVPAGLDNVIAIDAGGYFNLALKSDGTVIAWGDNGKGQCNIPTGLSDVIAISAGYEHSVALKADGTIVAWGSNEFGQITVSPGLTGVVEISAGSWYTMARTANGTRARFWGANTPTAPASGASGVRAAVAGNSDALVLNSDGTLTASGTGAVASIPVGLSQVKAIAMGATHALALKADGTVVTWGAGDNNALDIPGGLTGVKAISARNYHNVALKSDGTVVAWGFNSSSQNVVPASVTNIVAVESGNAHNISLKADGTVEVWGSNASGERVIPGGLANVKAVDGGGSHMIALKADGTVTGWGATSSSQIVNLSTVTGVKAISAGNIHTQMLKSDGTLAIRGTDQFAQTLSVPSGLNAVRAISSGIYPAVTIVSDLPPVLSGIASGMNYNEGAPALTLQSTAVITDNGHTSLAGATISVSDGFLTGDKLAVTVRGGVTQAYDPATGILTLTGNATITDYQLMLRSLTYESTSATPASNATRTITVSLNDGALTGTHSFTLNVTGVNDAPSFNSISSLIMDEDGAAVSVNLLSSISPGPADETGQTLTIDIVNDNSGLFAVQPTITFNTPPSTGRLNFTVAANAHGTANLTIKLTDDGGTANGGVDQRTRNLTISVNSINDAPSFTKGADVVISEDAGAQTFAGWATNITPGPSNESAQTVTFSVSNDNTTLFSAQPSLDAAGNLTFTPAANASGVANVTVTLTDNGGTTLGGINSLSQTFTITINEVNDAPTFTTGTSVFAWEDTPPQTLNGWLNGPSAGPAEEAGQTLTVETENSNNSFFAVQPAVSLTGQLTFTLAPHVNGSVTITIRLIDDGGTVNGGIDRTEKTFTLTVQTVNDAPSFTKGADVIINEDAGVQAINGWATDISPGPANEAAQTWAFSVTSNDNTGLFSVQPAMSATGDLTFTPVANASGVAHITFMLTDNGGTLRGGVNNVSETFSITINDVNDAPSFTIGSNVTRLEDAGVQTITGWATNISAGQPNETSQTISFHVTNDNNDLFSIQPSVNASGDLTFTPAANKFGSATVKIYIEDNGGTAGGGVNHSSELTFSIDIDPVNDAPSFTAGPDIELSEDAGAQTFNNWATNISKGPDESGQSLTVIITNDNNALFDSQPSMDASGNLTFLPEPDRSGTALVTVLLRDNGGTANGGGNEETHTFTITVHAINDAPSYTKGMDIVINEDAGAQTYNGWATGISPGPPNEITQTLVFNVSNDNNELFSVQPSLTTSGELTFTPAPDKSGVTSVTVTLRDNGGTMNGGVDQTTQTFAITIGSVNDSPSFTKGNDIIANEDAGVQVVSGWATGISAGPEESSEIVSFTVNNDNNSLFSIQPAVSATGVLTFTSAQEKSGIATVTVSLRDNGGTNNGGSDESGDQTFVITINPVNDAPSFVKGSDLVLNEDAGSQTIHAWATNISAGPFEISQTLVFNTSNDNSALFSVQPHIDLSGDLTFIPATNAAGSARVTVTLKDDGGTANGGVDELTELFTITIGNSNDAPSFISGPDITLLEDAPVYTARWATGISAGDGEHLQSLNFEVTISNSDLFAEQPTISSAGILSFKPAPDVSGTATLTVRLRDDGGTNNSGMDQSPASSFVITVLPVNDAPGIEPVDDLTIDTNSEPLTVTLTGIHAGEEDQVLTIEAVSDPSLVTVSAVSYSGGSSATILLTPSKDNTGIATVTVRLRDNGGIENGGRNETIMTFNIAIEEGIQRVYVPTLFTPDGSGMNDVFRVRASGVAEIQLNVYNAYGQQVFSTNDVTTALETGWNGFHQGRQQPAGSYTWTLTGKYINGKPLTGKENTYGQVILVH